MAAAGSWYEKGWRYWPFPRLRALLTAWGWNLCSRLRSQPQGLVVLLRAAGMNQDGREDSSDEEAEESGPWKITLPVAEANHALYT